ncbi:hypothetical protein DPE81_19855 [Salmonella enterica subsp. enterica]|nr:hypothetical protein [Salmonella enterica subsp. enterica]MIG40565.1 hypothetical protein [Salmonella enterica subsp. enterica]
MSDSTLTVYRLAQAPIKLRYNANKKRRSGAFYITKIIAEILSPFIECNYPAITFTVNVFFVRQYPSTWLTQTLTKESYYENQ